jgi:hypothetical protein
MKTKSLLSILVPVFLALFPATQVCSQCAEWDSIYYFSWGINHNYGIVKAAMPWEEASQCAQDFSAYLVQIESQEEQDVIYDAIVNSGISPTYCPVPDGGGTSYIWIGATDKFEEGTWLWDGTNSGTGDNFWNGEGAAGSGNGAPVGDSFVNWGGKSAGTIMEPDNWNEQDAAAIALTGWPFGTTALGIAGEWNDIGIENSIYFIMEYIPEAVEEQALNDRRYTLNPNPATGFVEIGGIAKGDQVAFISADGRLVESSVMKKNNDRNAYDITAWSKGIYIVRISNSACTKMLRFIKY